MYNYQGKLNALYNPHLANLSQVHPATMAHQVMELRQAWHLQEWVSRCDVDRIAVSRTLDSVANNDQAVLAAQHPVLEDLQASHKVKDRHNLEDHEDYHRTGNRPRTCPISTSMRPSFVWEHREADKEQWIVLLVEGKMVDRCLRDVDSVWTEMAIVEM